ncbi:Tyrosine-protein kinase [Trema orientale]|uniref:non-specific serine/threonine protein kinase n=1 Tax=Trema orientale TaxID=63057 RepID=A0A2P5FR33_TREOI|nr:Tyrosine-protein kinase [Trema orientale]
MNTLLELQLGQNQLSGYIPKMPPNLQISLNLSNNLFEGPIPKTLAGLTGLEVLDLSNNNFSGEIPDFLTQLGSLTQLLLSNNSLSGVVPNFGPWVLVDTSGNKNLRNAIKPTTSSKSGKQNSVAVIVLEATIPVFAVGVGTIIAILLILRYTRKNLPQGTLLAEDDIHRSNIDFNKAMKALAFPSNIVLKTRFSTYYKAVMPSGSNYFVKKLNGSNDLFQLASRERLRTMLEVFGKLSNSNVMTPLAYVLTVSGAFLFYEFTPRGSLFDNLHKSSGSDVDWASRYSIAVGVAQGLAYLHGIASGPILLLDMSSKNIFLNSLMEPLVGDIELYKVIDPSKSTGNLTTVAGSVGYIPPEYAFTMRITMAANVYSFGVVLLELLTGKPPVSEGTELAKWVLSNSVHQDNWDQILDSTLSRISPDQMLAVLKVALHCIGESPDERPAMNSVLQMLLDAR